MRHRHARGPVRLRRHAGAEAGGVQARMSGLRTDGKADAFLGAGHRGLE